MLSLLVLVPLLVLFILNLPLRNAMQKLALWAALGLAVWQVVAVWLLWAGFADNSESLTSFFTLGFRCDGLAQVLLLCIGIVVFTTVLVGCQTISNPAQRFGFLNLVIVALIGMNGTVMLTDLFSIYVFIEITAVASFILIAFERNINALEGAFKYMILSATATVMMILSIAILLLFANDTSFTSIAAALSSSSSNPLILFATGVFVCGLFIKGGVVPFHGWLPAAYSAAPAASSVLLAGIATKVSGIYTLIRLVTTVLPSNTSINHILLLVGIISILVGAFAALGQNDFKRLLAYSSISQVGYIILGLSCGAGIGVFGAVLHLFNHSIFKSLLFVNCAAVQQQSGTTDMDKHGGLGTRMPITNITSLIGLLSTAGVPPLAGFWSKLFIVIALWQAQYYTYAVIAVFASILTLAYMLKMERKVFFGIPSNEMQNITEAGIGIVLPASILAAITIGVGLLFPFIFSRELISLGIVFK
jgi:proton-translocating NADH-quinone oxidoreductase chain N